MLGWSTKASRNQCKSAQYEYVEACDLGLE